MFKKCSVIHRMDSNESKVTQVSSSSFCNDFSILDSAYNVGSFLEMFQVPKNKQLVNIGSLKKTLLLVSVLNHLLVYQVFNPVLSNI